MTPDPLARAVAGFRAVPVPVPPPAAGLLARLAAAEPARPSWRRTVTRTAPYLLAASVLAAGFLLVGGSSVALADVIEAAGRHQLVRYKRTLTHAEPGKGVEASRDEVCHDDLRAARHRFETRHLTLNETVESVFTHVTDGAKDRTLTVLTETLRPLPRPDKMQRQALDMTLGKFPRREATLLRASEPLLGQPLPDRSKTFLARLRELEADAKATRETRAGTARFRLEAGNTTTQLWTDVDTRLPTRLEHDELMPMKGVRLTWVYTDFEWDPKLPGGMKSADELFSVTPPAGYALTDRTAEK